MKEIEILPAIQERLAGLLGEVPFLKEQEQQVEAPATNSDGRFYRADLLLSVTAGKRRWKIIVEAKSVGEPKLVRYAIQQLKEYLAGQKNVYGVVAVPYITEVTARVCRENGVGYVDLAGNCHLDFDRVYVDQRNYPNPSPERRQARSLFSPKSSRIPRVLLVHPGREWQVQELASEASVSLGLASRIKERLLNLELAREDKRAIVLVRPRELLEEWAANYSYRKNMTHNYFSLRDPKQMERDLAAYCDEKRISYALTMFSGADLVAPFARYTRGFAYVSKGIRELGETLGMKEVTSGPTFTILEPYDEGVFYASQDIDGLRVVSDVQLFLDLAGYKGRVEKSARFLLEQRMATQW